MSPAGIAGLWFGAILSLVRLARLGRAADIVAVHTNTSAVLVGPLVAALLGVPHIWHIHEIVDHPRWLGRTIGVATRVTRSATICSLASRIVTMHLARRRHLSQCRSQQLNRTNIHSSVMFNAFQLYLSSRVKNCMHAC